MLNTWADKFVVTTGRHTQPLPSLIMSIMTPPPSRPLTLSAMAVLCWHYESIAAKIRGINVIYWRTNLSHANEIYFHLITINIFPRDPRNILTI